MLNEFGDCAKTTIIRKNMLPMFLAHPKQCMRDMNVLPMNCLCAISSRFANYIRFLQIIFLDCPIPPHIRIPPPVLFICSQYFLCSLPIYFVEKLLINQFIQQFNLSFEINDKCVEKISMTMVLLII